MTDVLHDVAVIAIPSRYDRPPHQLVESVRESLDEPVAGVAVNRAALALTEVAGHDRAEALEAFCDRRGLDLAHQRKGDPGLAECAIVAGEGWTIVEWKAYELGPDLGPGDIVMMMIALLEHDDSGRTLLVSQMHLPASVEGSWRDRGRRVRVHIASVLKARRIHRRWRKRLRPDGAIAWADWNLSLRLLWVRAWIRGAWPAMKVTYRVPEQGTHAGGRLIDWCLTRWLRNVRLRVLEDRERWSDHDRAVGLFTLRRRARRRRA